MKILTLFTFSNLRLLWNVRRRFYKSFNLQILRSFRRRFYESFNLQLLRSFSQENPDDCENFILLKYFLKIRKGCLFMEKLKKSDKRKNIGTYQLTITLLLFLLLITSAAADNELTTIRNISNQTLTPGSTFTVILTTTVNTDNTRTPGLSEDLPEGWNVTSVDSSGLLYKASTSEWIGVKEMSIGDTILIKYNVTVPADALPQDYEITGFVSAFNVKPIRIEGESTMNVTGNPTTQPTESSPTIALPIVVIIGLILLLSRKK